MLLDLWFHHITVTLGGYIEPEKIRRIPQPEPWRPREDEEALMICGLL